MKIVKYVLFTLAVLVAVVSPSAVQAQRVASVSFEGMEISTGHEELTGAYGWMCYAKATGAVSGNFNLSMDYLGMKAPGTSSYVTGGAWTLPVYAPTKFAIAKTVGMDPYQGVLFGSVDAGTVTWDKTGATATVELSLRILGGTQTLADLTGTAVLYGIVSFDQKGGTARFEGKIDFEFE